MPGREHEATTEPERNHLLSTLYLAIVAATVGCQTAQRLEVSESGAPMFKRFRAEYCFEQPKQLLGHSFEIDAGSAAGSGVRTVGSESIWPEASLKIECPHPGGDTNLALLTLTLNDLSRGDAIVRKEVRQLSVSRSQVELLISDLARNGYFDESADSDDDSRLTIQIDRGKVDRRWRNDARILDLAHQTLTDGTSAAH